MIVQEINNTQIKKDKKLKIKSVETYYDLQSEKREKYLMAVKKAVQKQDRILFHEMAAIVEKHVNRYEADFYIHDLNRLLETDSNFLWLVRENGTFLIILDGEENESKIEWFHSIHFNCEIKGYYILNNSSDGLKKINKIKANKLIESLKN